MEQMKDRLKQLRQSLSIKQRELAERLGVQVGLIGNWESGARPIPKTRIYQICKEYNVREEWLTTGEGEMFVKAETFKDQMKAMFNELSPENQAIWLECAAEIVKAGSDTKNGGGNAVRKLYELLKVKHDRKTKSSGVNATIIGDGNEQNIRVQK